MAPQPQVWSTSSHIHILHIPCHSCHAALHDYLVCASAILEEVIIVAHGPKRHGMIANKGAFFHVCVASPPSKDATTNPLDGATRNVNCMGASASGLVVTPPLLQDIGSSSSLSHLSDDLDLN